MSLNYNEINTILNELNLEGSFIQKIQQPDFASLIMQIYGQSGRWRLYICLKQGETRLHRLTRQVENKTVNQRFIQFCKSHIKGGKIVSAQQLGDDRIIRLHITRPGDEYYMFIRLWSGASNVIITNTDGTVLDAFYRRPKRGEVSGGTYIPESGTASKHRPVREYPGNESFNDFIEAHYFSISNRADQEKIFKEAEKKVHDLLNDLRNRRDTFSSRLEKLKDFDHDRQCGDTILSQIGQIPAGEKELTVSDPEDGIIQILLDPEQTPQQNAAIYYQRYKKRRKQFDLAKQELAKVNRELAKKEEELNLLLDNGDPAELQHFSSQKSTGQEKQQDRPGLRFESGAFVILAGRNARENDELLRKHTRGNDMWLHTRDYPGGYIFIKAIPGKSIPLEVLLDGGELALHYSKGKGEGAADLYYTHVKYLRRAKGAARGTVLPTHEKNLHLKHEDKRLQRLLTQQEAV